MNPAPHRAELALVGNDVVDLGDPENQESFARPGYVERVCTLAERRVIDASGDPERTFWCLFAGKEAAYKLLVKLGEEPGLAHRKIEVAADLGSATYDERRMVLGVAHGDAWVHALASVGPAAPCFEVVELAPHSRASAASRELACRMAATALGVASDRLSVERRPSPSSYDGFEPPRLCEDGTPTGLDVSLSHDGRFVAAALATGTVPWATPATR